MVRRLFVIAEHEADCDILEIIPEKCGLKKDIQLQKRGPTKPDKTGGVSRLAEQLEKFIKDINETKSKRRAADECIVVLHDADLLSRPSGRESYEQIANICRRYGAIELIAHDELEAWILSDKGFCKFLGMSHINRDHLRKPSDELKTRLNTKKIRYSRPSRTKILARHMDGDIMSNSFKECLTLLRAHHCL